MYDKQLGVQFQSEVRTLAQVEHLNLVKFHGFVEHEDERIVIVEYVPNGTLREHLDCEFFIPPLCEPAQIASACICVGLCVNLSI